MNQGDGFTFLILIVATSAVLLVGAVIVEIAERRRIKKKADNYISSFKGKHRNVANKGF